jgi:hypothetical protein
MPSKLLIIAAPVAFALVTTVAIAAQDNQGEGPWANSDFVTTRPGPLNDINVLVVPPQVDAHTFCRQGIGTGAQGSPIKMLECTSIGVAPDPHDCPPGESLITIWRGSGNITHVCVSARANEALK